MTVKSSALLWSFLLLASSSYAQLTGISVEEYVDHTTTGIAELEGFITYRVYVDCTNPSDEISAIYGDATSPLVLTSTAGFYQNTFGEPFGWSINPAFFGAFPSLEYDSWVTIGAENNVVIVTHNTVGLDMTNFESGGDFVVDHANGGSWFNLWGEESAQAGDDLKVLIAQLTIPAGSAFTGNFNVQLFVNGEQSNSTQYPAVPFSSQADAIFGCMDPEATNYNEDATEQGEACTYPCALDISIAEVIGTSCPGAIDGEVMVTAAGGQLGVIFQIEGSTAELWVGNFNELAGGTYTVTATDGAGCVDSIEIEIVEPAPIEISASMTAPVSCSGDEDAVISGMSQGGTGVLSFSLNTSFTNSTNELYFDGLGPGLYNVLAMDENGCLATGPAIYIESPTPPLVAVAGGQNGITGATCADSEDGIVALNYMGGSGGAGSGLFSSDGVNFSPGNVLFLNPGTYTFYAMDANGCIAETANEYTVDGPPPIEWGIDVYSPACYGEDGVVYVSANGGNGGFTYMLEDQAYTGAFETFLGAGIFEVSATDIGGCVVTETFEITEPDPIDWELQVIEEPTCSNGFMGTMAMEATGGTEDQYELFVAGVDFFLVNSFEWTSPAGMFTFELIDANGCNASGQYTLEGQPSMEGFQPVVFEPTCFGDSDGSLMPDLNFEYTTWSVEWTGPSSGTSEVFEIIEGLSAGSYTLDLASTEYPDCASTISVVVGQPDALLIEVEGAGPNCPGELSGLLMAEVSEAQGSISWNLNGVFISDEPVLSIFGLSSGTFTLGVIDDVGCASMATVVLDGPTDLGSFEVVIAQPTSFSNGSITLEVPSGTNVEWYDESDVQIAEGNAIEALSSGTYTAMMTSAAGCTESASYELEFAGCALTDALDWPLEAEGFFPTESAIWYLGQELMSGVNASTSEWILRIPDLITDGGINYPVVSFVLDSFTGLPPGVNVELDFGAPMLALESRCVQFAGMPVVTGDYEVTLTGVLAIALFGTSFDVDGFSFSKIVSVQDNPETAMGCTYEWASNFNPFADLDDGSCSSDWGCPNLEACNYNPYSSATEINCDFTCLGCTYVEAENYDSASTLDDGTCAFQSFDGNEGACFFDFDESGNVGATDLLMFLEAYGVSCQ